MPSSVRMILFCAWVVLTSVRYREILRRATIPRYQSSVFGIWIRYLDAFYLVISHGMGYDITIYRDVYHAAPDHPETTGKQTRNLVAVYCLFWLSVCTLFLPCLSSVSPFFVILLIRGTHHRTDRTTSKQKQQHCPLRARPTPWAHACSFL